MCNGGAVKEAATNIGCYKHLSCHHTEPHATAYYQRLVNGSFDARDGTACRQGAQCRELNLYAAN